MTDINILNEKFENSGKLSSELDLGADAISEAAVHQVVKATLAGKRQGTASTKNRALVSGGGTKPFKQKGTGRARQGSSRSPLLVGGGTVFGPTPRDYSQKVNKRMMKRAIQSVLADKLQAGKLHVISELKSSGKTKELFETLNSRNMLPGLVVASSAESPALRAARNLRHGKGVPASGFSVYEAVKYENLIIEKQAFEQLLERLV